MDKQKNIDMYYAEMVEMYSKKHQMSKDEVLELFLNRFVYEKIVSSIDSWGHYTDDENLELIEEELDINDNGKMFVYHGTVTPFDIIDLIKSKGNRDFGNGFYTTVMYGQSYDWANTLAKRRNAKNMYVYSYLYDLNVNKSLNIKHFTSISEEWFDFVVKNRKSKTLMHNYDIVSGPVADDNINVTLSLYESGEISKKDALDRLTYKKTSNQISFHTIRALKCLTFSKKEAFKHE